MEATNPISIELSEIESRLLISKPANSYITPAGYFDSFAENMLKKIKALEAISPDEELLALSPLLQSISRKTPQTVPDNYFSILSENTTALVQGEFLSAEQEIAALSPLVQRIGRAMPYTVPAQYFDNLRPVKNKIFTINKNSWPKYAAAAAILIVILTTGLFINNKPNSPSNTDRLALIQKQAEQMTPADMEEWQNFLEPAAADDGLLTKTAAQEIVKDLSEQELNNFMEMNQDLDFLFDVN